MNRCDVVVWGGGCGGAAAAIQAARAGAKTILFTPGVWLGGMVSAAGVCAPDGHELTCWQTGFWGAFLRELHRREPSGLDHNWVSCFGYTPTTAETILQQWVAAEDQLQWIPQAQLELVHSRADRITGLDVQALDGPCRVTAEVFIDGSDLGDLLATADQPFRWGWESKETWAEPSAPTRKRLQSEPFFRDQPIQSPTWVVMGQLNGDCPVARDQHRLPPPFEASTVAFGLEKTITYGRLPGGLVMLNWPLHGNDWHHNLERAISPNPTVRNDLAADMQRHSHTFLGALQTCSSNWIGPGQAFPGTDTSLALMPYWREGRRLVGRSTVTENDLLPVQPGARRGPLPTHSNGSCSSIAIGTYANDHHYPGEDWPLAPKSVHWGGRWTGTPFCIPFNALITDAFSNLIVAEKGFSVSHIANGATRLQPLILNIGQAAGLAAAMAAQRAIPLADLPVRDLQLALIHNREAPAAVMPIWEWPIWHPHWAEAQERALLHPDQLGADGHLAGQLQTDFQRPAPDQAPRDRFERTHQGEFRRRADGSMELLNDRSNIPLITLEPAIHTCLDSLEDHGSTLELRGVMNPWGPWLRVTGVTDHKRRS